MIAISRGPGGTAGGQPAAAMRVPGMAGAAPGVDRPAIAAQVAAENVAAQDSTALLLGGGPDTRRQAGATFDREL